MIPNTNRTYPQAAGNRPELPPTTEPPMCRKDFDLLDHLANLQALLYTLNDRLYGPIPSDPSIEDKMGDAPLEYLVARACQRAANLVGFAESINSRL